MTENKNGHHGPNSFVWGLLIGALLATLITTKKGRQILRDLTDLGLEIFEDFVEQKTREANGKKEPVSRDEEEMEEATADIESEITEAEEKTPEEKINVKEEVQTKNGNGNGHSKKRLFKGIRHNK